MTEQSSADKAAYDLELSNLRAARSNDSRRHALKMVETKILEVHLRARIAELESQFSNPVQPKEEESDEWVLGYQFNKTAKIKSGIKVLKDTRVIAADPAEQTIAQQAATIERLTRELATIRKATEEDSK